MRIPHSRATGLMVIFLLSIASGCRNAQMRNERSQVVVYVSEDQVFSEPILKDFERETGITVKAVFDTEEAKSTGVMNRLIAERGNPQADVYWANEPMRAELLKQQGISAAYTSPVADDIPALFKDPDGHWTGFSARARVLVANTSAKQKKPTSILAYTDPAYRGRAVIANPLFGTTTAQMAALFMIWGDERSQAYLQGLKQNQVKISTSNGESADFVSSGDADFALVDSDDAVSRVRQKKPIEIIYPDQGPDQIGMLVLPNAVVMLKGAPHMDSAKRLIDYLLSKETERKLAFADCAQIPLHAGVPIPPELRSIETLKTMKVNYAQMARKMQEIHTVLKTWAGQ